MLVLRSSRLTLQPLLNERNRHKYLQVLPRFFSDAVDPVKRPHDIMSSTNVFSNSDTSASHVNGVVKDHPKNGYKSIKMEKPTMQFLSSYQDDEQLQEQDIEFTAQRIGFPVSDAEFRERADVQVQQRDDTGGIREESREEATAKAERIMAVLRHSMSELEIGKVIHRIAQYATLPRVTGLSRKQFLRSLETRFGENNKKELGYMLAFLQGRDDVIDQLEINSRMGENQEQQFSNSEKPNTPTRVENTEDFVVPKIMGLHPDLVADPQFMSIVLCYCRLACLNSLKLMKRPEAGFAGGSKSSLWQVKTDFRKVLDMEGFSHYADMLGLEKNSNQDGDEGIDAVDAEWEEFNLENDRIDFRMLLSQTQSIVDFMKRELPNETISKMLVAMLASVKTSKLHRKIFQEMVCNVQTAFPETYHEQLLSELVPFLSGDNASFDDFDSDIATTALHHHQMRNEAIIRALLETRMRIGHILIHDIDDVDPTQLIPKKLTPEQHERVITTAWNIVSVLDDRKYHMFFTRFLKYKLAWRPNRATFGDTFLSDVRKTLGPRDADAIMPMFEKVYQQLSVETLTICRVKLRHSGKLVRGRGALEPLTDAGRKRLETTWIPSRCAFYRNLPHGVTKKHLENALAHVGGIKRYFLFSNPINGPPESPFDDSDDPDDEEEGEKQEDESDSGSEKPKRRTKKKAVKAVLEESRGLKMLKNKRKIVASDRKTPYQAVVEFESESACRMATMRALQIFGVMMSGWNEYRPVFSSPVDERSGVTLMNVPYGTKVGDLVDEVNRILSTAGLKMNVSGLVPRGVLLTHGRLDLRFPSFVEAAQVIDRLNAHVSKMKRRRVLSGKDAFRFNEYVKLRERLKMKEKHAEKERKAEEEQERRDVEEPAEGDEDLLSLGVDEDDEVVDDVDVDDIDEDDNDDDEQTAKLKKKRYVLVVSETLEEYFEEWLEAERKMTEDELTLCEVPRPFDVTWTPLPNPRNNHMYL
ncbi:hypothetical protein PsorP6_003397 [Peronosclerospora sorghi]|uniref:Uncharacterized protein n=1 Tax=Peronosclerospora sorghi TaxID=230839 RepID=A0ACC0VNX6_9STRA|nr:hypothetical protein PsorP6_003397 [Peronosclerospora sorghi]